MSEQTKEEIDYLNQLLFDIDICDNFEELQEIAQEFEPPQKIDKKKKEENIKLTKEEIDGFTVYIGKTTSKMTICIQKFHPEMMSGFTF